MTDSQSPQPPFVPYEKQLDQDLELAMSEGSLFFEGRGRVQETLRRIAKRLDELGIPYAVAGGMALMLQGYRRYTDDVDIVVTRAGLERIHQELEGRGYLRPFRASKNLRDTQSGVKIEFLVTGLYPGDGKPKEISYPDPISVGERLDGVQVVNVPTLVTLKLASAMTGIGRAKDLGDVQEMIKSLHLPESLVEQLDPYVREKYREVWQQLRFSPQRYVLAEPLRPEQRAALVAEGALVDQTKQGPEGTEYLYTHDRVLADKYGMVLEDELLDR